MAFGVMGGPMQAQGHVQFLLRVLRGGQDPQSAIDAPRWQVLQDGRLAVEPSFDPVIIADLKNRGHDVETHPPEIFGGAQAIWALGSHGDRRYVGASDPRKDGQAVGR